MHFKAITLLLTAILSLFGSLAANASSEENKILKVGALRLTSHAPTFIAEQQGYFKQHNLHAELTFFQAAQPMALAIASGDIDVGVTAMTAGLVNLAEKGLVKVIGGALEERPGIQGQQILASNSAFEKGLTTPLKLNGYTFGITQAGSSFDYMAYKLNQAVKQQKSTENKSDINVVTLHKVSNIKASLTTGQIDAWAIIPNLAVPMAQNKEAHIIGQISDYIPNYQVTVLFASTSAIKHRPQQVKAFVESFKQGAQAYNDALVTKIASKDSTEQVIKSIHQYAYQDKSWEEAKTIIAKGAMYINPQAKIKLNNLKDQLHFLGSKQLISKRVTLNKVVDESFIQ